MTATDIRQALRSIGDGVDVPGVDPESFQGRVRQARRRRTGVRAGVGALALAVVMGVGVTAWSPWDRTEEPAPATNGGDTDTIDPSRLDWARDQIVVLVDGEVRVTDAARPDRLLDSGVEGDRLLSAQPLGALVQRDDVVTDYGLYGDGGAYGPENETHDVQRAWADHDSRAYAYLDASGEVRLAGLTDEPTTVETGSSQAPDIAALQIYGDGQWVLASAEGTGLRISTADTTPYVDLGSAAEALDVEGSTIAYQGADHVQFLSLQGHLRTSADVGPVGALAPSGQWYAATTTGQHALVLVDTTTGAEEPFPLVSDGTVRDVWWLDEERFYVVVDSGVRSVFECRMRDRSCRTRLVDRTSTLQLPQS
jgi:hypothetical protein